MKLINIFDAPIYSFETIDSTNKYAKDLCKDKIKNGTIVVSEHQTNGRGRLGNSWESPKNSGIYYSIIFEKLNDNLKYETLTLFLCLGITKLFENYSIISQIKWPNDILINGKKVCGILSECNSTSAGNFIVIGIGINVYQNENDFPEELKTKATSLKLHTSSTIIKNYLINNLTSTIYDFYNKFLSNGFDDFKDEYKTKSFLMNKEICVKVNGNDTYGKVIDFDNLGKLILKCENEILSINSGEVSLRNIYKWKRATLKVALLNLTFVSNLHWFSQFLFRLWLFYIFTYYIQSFYFTFIKFYFTHVVILFKIFELNNSWIHHVVYVT